MSIDISLDTLVAELKQKPMKKLAVAAANSQSVLEAVSAAYQAGIAMPVLCGNIEKIDFTARSAHIDISPFEIIEAENDAQAISIAVSLVRNKRADALFKGLVPTADIMRAVLDKEAGLRGSGMLSHVGIISSPTLKKPVFLTDCVLVTYPDLDTKIKLIENAVAVAQKMGIAVPKVAVLAAVETVNPKMPATVDAAVLAMMNSRGQIKNCLVDGPLAMDLALSPEAVKQKALQSNVAGDADIILFPNIDAGNAVIKTFTIAAGCTMGGIIAGAAAPIVMTSRSDTPESKLYSIACAMKLA